MAKNKGLKIKREAVQASDLLAKKQGLNVKGEALKESDIVGKAIIDHAKKNKIDVIVIGTEGYERSRAIFFWKCCQQSDSRSPLSGYLQSVEILRAATKAKMMNYFMRL